MRRFVLSVGLIVGFARIAASQTAQPLMPGDAEANAQLTALVETARSNGLPIDPIVAKVQYGRMVKAEPSRIVASARAIAARLEIARDVLAPATAVDITSRRRRARCGRDEGRASRGPQRERRKGARATPLSVLAQLLSSNVPLKRATEIVTSFLRRGATPEQLVAFGNNVNDDVTHGAAALAALDTRARFLSGVLAPAGSAAAAAGLQNTAAPKKP